MVITKVLELANAGKLPLNNSSLSLFWVVTKPHLCSAIGIPLSWGLLDRDAKIRGTFWWHPMDCFIKRKGIYFSSFRRRGLLPFDWIWKCIIITENALLPFLLAGEEIYILCYFTSRETESRPGALRSWLTLDCYCELFGAEEIKYPSFWSHWPQQSIFVVEFFLVCWF